MSLAERAEMLVRLAPFPLVGAATDTTPHCVPFQCSMSGLLLPLFLPTAQTLLDVRAATAERVAYAGAWLGTTAQAEPLQCRISGLVLLPPTAQASLVERAATPLSWPPALPPPGLGTTVPGLPS